MKQGNRYNDREEDMLTFSQVLRCTHFILYVVSCIVLCPEFITAQYPAQFFTNMTINDGLPSNKVNQIVKDSLGFHWYATTLGLVRHDGQHVDVYREDALQGPVLPSSHIKDIFIDKNNLLWARTEEGHVFTLDQGKAYAQQIETLYFEPDNIGRQQVNLITDSGEDHIYVICRDWSIYSVHIATRKISRAEVRHKEGRDPGEPISAIVAFGYLWIGSMQGLYQYDWKDKTLKEIDLDSILHPHERRQPRISTIAEFTDQRLLIGGGRHKDQSFYGLIEYHIPAGSARRVNCLINRDYDMDSFSVEIIHKLSHGEYILKVTAKGPCYYNFETRTGDTITYHRTELNRLNTTSINGFYFESGGKLMIASNQGIFIHDPSRYLFREIYPLIKLGRYPNQLSSTYYDEVQEQLIIAANNSLYKYDMVRDTTIDEMSLPRITNDPIGYMTPEIIPLSADSLLVLSNQIFIVDLRRWTFRVVPLPEEIHAAAQGRYHRWINHTHVRGTEMRDMYFVKDQSLISIAREGLRMRRIIMLDAAGVEIRTVAKGMAIDRDGYLWIATNTHKLLRLFPDLSDTAHTKVFHVLNDPALMLKDILIDNEDVLWLSTRNVGLIRAAKAGDTLEYTVYDRRHGLDTRRLEQLLEDRHGKLWMVTVYGIAAFNKKTKTFLNYSKPHGINFPHNMRVGKGVDSKGRMYFSEGIGIILFDPADFIERDPAPQVYIKEFRIFDSIVTSFWRDTAITLSWRQNNFSFRLCAVNHSLASMNRYRYMLEGYHQDWVYTDKDELLINFNNLPGGDYVFRFTAANHQGTWNPEEIQIAVQILPPFWRRWWFRAAIVLSLIACAFGLFYLRLRAIRRQELMLIQKEIEIQTEDRARIARDLHDAIGAQLSTVNMYIEAMNTHPTSEAETLGAEAQQLIRRTISDMSLIITELSPQALATYGFAAAVHEFLYHVRTSSDIKIQYQLSQFTSRLPANAEAALFRITQELFNNTVKHAGAKNINFSITEVQDKAVLMYSDDGIGFDHEKVLRGRGLHNIESRVKLLRGKMTLHSTEGQGVLYRIEFPTRHSA